MNIILANGQRVPTIKGWELEGPRVTEVFKAKINEDLVDVFLTKSNFYLHLNNAWYNGSIQSTKDLHSNVRDVLMMEGDTEFKTARKVQVTTPEVDLSHLQTSEGESESGLVDNQPSIERLMKKEALKALEEGKTIYLAKYNKRTDSYLEDTLLTVPSYIKDKESLDDFLNGFFKLHSANKSTTRFYVEV